MAAPSSSSPSIVNSLAANVEATLTFTLASKLVDILLALQQGGSTNNASSTAAATTWMLGAVCLMVLSVSASPSSSASSQWLTSPAARDLAAMLNQTLVLALSRVVLLQARV